MPNAPQAPPLTGYTLWLSPASPQKYQFQSLIKHLATFSEDAPVFEPHITLLAPVSLDVPLGEIEDTLGRIVAELGGLQEWKLQLKAAQKGDFYFQSVLAPVEPTKELLALREKVEQAFSVPGQSDYFPHLSLLYGDISAEKRDSISAEANKESKEDGFGEVEIGEIEIVRCVGDVADWVTVGKLTL
ncbi:hypothetical protein L202_02678 [Cryptococcus amylolentus CBS 6039]|uniref:2',3'-cyclic-nucleotide 3'-phosphodiesterase n=2 Tax=Cryptococcus amylolentus TaxID=104669 RepID=A0A1E3HVS9_9TREE|nr:hypothetical protein L202_02678 [Cryptococcus amylolentus CBS 6039]ODN80433.1 hypothetical protein L202_02678 [Cryptococcus amylolentus CBS 6039]ODO09057.1 hypothetical protein I350_02656 [Cryptococcus amylolentus CBS 6273]